MTDSQESMIGYIGRFIAPIFKPLGFGQWQASVALIAGLIAKESVISTMNILYNNNLLSVFSSAQAYSFMVFILLYMPCVSAFVSMKKELGSWKWALMAALIELSSAYFISMIAYNICKIIF